ncbi:B12-binding domain-containing radical SAM protein [Staphylothermus hellenicus]
MSILVIDALARASGSRYSTFDVVGAGPRVVAGIIKNAGFKTDLKAYELVINKPEILRKYKAIMISAMSSDKGALSRLLSLVEKINYKGYIIVGGPISFEYKELLRNNPRINYVLIGEAEIPLPKLLDKILTGKNVGGVPAIAFRDESGEIKATSPHLYTPAEIISRNKPWIEIEKSYPDHKIYRYYVEVVRGCSNYFRPVISGVNGLNCIKCFICRKGDLEKRMYCPANIPPGCGFCSVPYMFGPARSRSIDSIVEEIRELIIHGAKRIVLSAPDFLDYGRDLLVKPKPLTDPCYPEPNIEMIEALLSSIFEIEEVRNRNTRIFIENIKACLVNEDVARILGKYLSGTTIHIGLETGDTKYNSLVLGKPISVEHVYKAVKLLKAYGLRPYVYLMYGLPLANEKVYRKTLKTINKLSSLGVEKITLYKFVPLPGTAFQDLKPDIKRHSRIINLIKKKVEKHNLMSKKSLIGRKIHVLLLYNNGKYYGYPINHGPTVFVKGLTSPRFSGCEALVEIYDVAPRFVWGKFIRILAC